MEKSFVLEIFTPRRRVFNGPVTSLIVPAELGYLGVWAHHAPLVTTLVPGKIVYRDEGGSTHALRVQGTGFLEVRQNTATVLAEEVGEA